VKQNVFTPESIGLSEKMWLAKNITLVEDGFICAFAGAAVIGHVTNVFQSLTMASPSLVIQTLPMELTI